MISGWRYGLLVTLVLLGSIALGILAFAGIMWAVATVTG